MKNRFTNFYLFSLIFLILSGLNLYATDDINEIKSNLPKLLGANNAGKEFWFSVPPCYEESSDPGSFVKIFVTSPVKTKVTLEVPSIGYIQNKTTIANDVIEFNVGPATAQCFVHNGSQSAPVPEKVYPQRAVHIYAQDPLVIYVVVRYYATSDGFLALPVASLGNEYIVSSYPDMNIMFPSYKGFPSMTTITAPFNNTRVKFTLGGAVAGKTGGGMVPGETKEWRLDKGDVIVFMSEGPLGVEPDLSGSKVKADKPIAVVSGNHCANIPTTNQWCDYICEMEIPTYTWGKNYHVPRTINRKYSQIVRIYAKEPNTQIYRDGKNIGLIKKSGGILGEGFLEMRINGVGGAPRDALFSGNKPIGVTFYNPGTQEDNAGSFNSDPFQMVMTPIEQYQKEITFCTPAVQGGKRFAENYLSLVYETLPDGTMADDMEIASVTNGSFVWEKLNTKTPLHSNLFPVDVNNKKYGVVSLRLAKDGVYKIRGLKPFACYSYGFDFCDSYGYPTSAALMNLEIPDVDDPKPTYTIDCEGNVQGEVIDLPAIDSIRSNLSDVFLLSDVSFNYEFDYDPIVPGVSKDTKWRLKVTDLFKDARAVILFADRAGNDTTLVIEYKATNISITDNKAIFGDHKLGTGSSKKIYVKNESKTGSITVGRIELARKDQGFTLKLDGGVTLPKKLAPQEVITCTVNFDAAKTGFFVDSIYVGDYQAQGSKKECFVFGGRMEASVGNPLIDVSDIDFGQQLVGLASSAKQFSIKNNGSSKLVINGYTGPTNAAVYTTDLPAASSLKTNPIELEAGQSKSFNVIFKPDAEKTYPDQIVFQSDAKGSDSICVLNGEGIRPMLAATSYDWGRKRIHRSAFPVGPYTGEITLSNDGTKDVNISKITIADAKDRAAFVFDENDFMNLKVEAKSSKKITFEFKPIKAGPHKLVINWENDANANASTTLEGIGTVPVIKTNDVNYPARIIGDAPIGSIGDTYTEFVNENWGPYADNLTIQSLNYDGAKVKDIGLAFGTEGFRFNKTKITDASGKAISFPVVLQPGEKIRFTGEFVAQRGGQHQVTFESVSDAAQMNADNTVAKEDGDVISTWTGTGAAQNWSGTGDETTICKSQKDTLVVTLTNTEATTVNVKDISLDPASSLLKILTPAPFALPQGNKEVKIEFAPAGPVALIPDVVVKTDAVKDSIKRIPIKATAVGYERLVSSAVNPKETIIGKDFVYALNIDAGDDLALSNAKKLTAKIKYNSNYVTLDVSKIAVGSSLSGKFTIEGTPSKQILGGGMEEVTVILNGNTKLSGANKIEVLTAKFVVYLPSKTSGETDPINLEKKVKITHELYNDDACLELKVANESEVTIKPICVDNMRSIILSKTSYALGKVNPNPVNANGGNISFGVGLKGFTEIKIYNSNSELVTILVSAELEEGEYSARIPIEQLSSGVYFYEMVSGPFKSTEKLVIQK